VKYRVHLFYLYRLPVEVEGDNDLTAIEAAVKRAQNDDGLWPKETIFTADGHELDLSDEFGETVLVDQLDEAGQKPSDEDGTWYNHVMSLGYKPSADVDQALQAALGGTAAPSPKP
jgi:hypothetical protein